MEVLSDPPYGTPLDKVRLFLIYFLCFPAVSDAEYDMTSMPELSKLEDAT